MKKMYISIIAIFGLWLTFSAYALDLNQIRKGCESSFERFSEVAPQNVVRQTINEAIGVNYDDSISYCLEMAKAVDKGLDEKIIDLGGPNKASINQVVSIIGERSRNPALFTRKDKKCSPSSDESAEANCSAGCLNYYLNSNQRDMFIGFASAFNVSFHAARYKMLNMNHILPEVGKCADYRKGASSALCTFNYCTVIHSSYQEANKV
ncbi:hypothetical protein BIT28_16180 [Photobacterium proteolyticum]|uniref:Uncharacterized protein n=2 Tax=Photobacterium proteolyticum TaxID=1903952 RepID=A0A1Q9GSA2_9GAMM|nr:hypothetical protein BIT28_16180 [Photobacterium proteolyticum]